MGKQTPKGMRAKGHEDCPKLMVAVYVDPCEQIVRQLVCSHGVYDYEYPKSMMIVWPDGKTSIWPENKG